MVESPQPRATPPKRAGDRGAPRAWVAGLMAVAVHLLVLAALTLGVHLQREPAVPVVVELWSEPPQPAPPPRAEATPPLAPPEPVKPVPPPPPPAPPKADIGLEAAEAKRKEEARRVAEKKAAEKKAAEAKRKEEERQAAEAKAADRKSAERKAAEQKQQEAQRREEERRAAETERLRREQDELARRAAEAGAAAQAKLLASYIDKIRAKVRGLIVEPPGVPATAVVEFDVVLIPGGDVLSVRLRRSSGFPLYDEAVERAIKRAEPLPIPPEPQQFAQFRELRLQIRRQDP